MRVMYLGQLHEVVEARDELFLLTGKDWGVRTKVSTDAYAPYYHLRCLHPNPCRDLEYIKKISSMRLLPGKKGSSRDDFEYYEKDQPTNSWIGKSLCVLVED